MDNLIQISKINDFIFCPYSIYLHEIYNSFHQYLYHDTPQAIGKMAHEKIEQRKYSSKKDILQGLTIVSSQFGLIGKIDLFDCTQKLLIERKQRVKIIFDGYRYQLYAQYFGLQERGYKVLKLRIHSFSDNKNYDFLPPNAQETIEFKQVIEKMRNFSVGAWDKKINPAKCQQCIYRTLCGYSLC
jgi:CRISPR-associated exonuclease Cas4